MPQEFTALERIRAVCTKKIAEQIKSFAILLLSGQPAAKNGESNIRM